MAEYLKHKTKIGMYWTFLNQSATQIMQFVVGIVMARLLSPSDYGITTLPGVFLAVAAIFKDSGFGKAFIRKHPKECHRYPMTRLTSYDDDEFSKYPEY